MHDPVVTESPRRRIVRRVGAAGIALAAALVLAGCHEAYGGGYIGAAVDGSPVFNDDASFGSTFQCDDGVKGQITYHDSSTNGLFPGLKLHGTVENILVDDNFLDDIPAVPADTCEDVMESSWAQFEGSYRSKDTTLSLMPAGRFIVLVFDQGEPGRTSPAFDGDGFSIDLMGGPYPLYTRAGYIEGGNIQVDN